MQHMEKITLFDRRWGEGEYSILDVLVSDKELKLDGVHGGTSVNEDFGDSDYEFARTYQASEFPKILMHLLKECFDKKIFTNESDFHKFCEERGIASSFWSYI